MDQKSASQVSGCSRIPRFISGICVGLSIALTWYLLGKSAKDQITLPQAQAIYETTDLESPSGLIVEVGDAPAILRSGPGVAYRKVAIAQPERRFTVKNWKQDWFEVQAMTLDGEPRQTGWIRNDLVKALVENP